MSAGERWGSSRREGRSPELPRAGGRELPIRGSAEWNEALNDSFSRLEHRLNSLAASLDNSAENRPAVPPQRESVRAEESGGTRPSFERERPAAATRRVPPPERDHAQRLDAALAEIAARQRTLDTRSDSRAAVPGRRAEPDTGGDWRAPESPQLRQDFTRVRERLARGTERAPLDRLSSLSAEAGFAGLDGSTTVREAIAAKRTAAERPAQSEPIRENGGIALGGGRDHDARLAGLAEDLSRLGRAVQGVTTSAAERAVAVDGKLTTLTRSMQEIGGRIDRLGQAMTGVDADALRSLRGALQDIAGRISVVSAGDHAGQQSIREAIEAVSARLDRIAGSGRPDSNIERVRRELSVMGERMIEAVRGELQRAGRGGDGQADVLRDAIERLAARLERAEQRSHFDPTAVAEATVERMAARQDLPGSAQALARLERGVADILRQIEDGRALAAGTAEATAARAVHTTLATLNGAHLPDFGAVAVELTRLREAASENQRLTIDALIGVRDALARVTERFGQEDEAGIEIPAAVATDIAEDDDESAPLTTLERARAAAEQAAAEAQTSGTFAPIFRASVDSDRNAAGAAQERAQLIASARRALLESEAERLQGESRTPRLREPLAADSANDNVAGGRRLRRASLGVAAALVLAGSWQVARVLLAAPTASEQTAAADTKVPQQLADAAPAKAAPAKAQQLAEAATPAETAPSKPAPATDVAAGTPRVVTADDIEPPAAAAPGAEPINPPKAAATPTAPPAAAVDPSATASLPAAPAQSQPEAAVPAPVPNDVDAGAALPEAIGSAKLRKEAATGNPEAQYEIGLRYYEGEGVTRDPTAAAKWFTRAAAHDLAPAEFRLGTLYEKGIGVAKDPATARKWYGKAAETGNVRAMHNLGVLYANGVLGTPDFASAARWFRRAADYGLRDSQYNLGVLYARGLAVKQNLAEAYLWFALAADQGDKDAAAKRDEIASKLGKQQLVTARLAAGTWHAKTPIESANEVAPPPGGWDGKATADAHSAREHRH